MKRFFLIIGSILLPFLIFGCLSTDINSIEIPNDNFDVTYDDNGVPQSKGNLYVFDISNVTSEVGCFCTLFLNATDSDVEVYYLDNSEWKKIRTIQKNDSEGILKSTFPDVKYYGFKYLGNSNYEYELSLEQEYNSDTITIGLPKPNWNGGSSDKIIESIITSSIADLNTPIIIQSQLTSKPNSAGGVSIYIDFWNISNKTLKYVYFDIEPYNRVGDLTTSEITGKSLVSLQVTDFIESFKSYSGYWENVWYNNSIGFYKIKNIRVVYFDNSEESLTKNQIDDILNINPIKYSFYSDNDLSLEISYSNGRVYCFAITKKNLKSLDITFETNPKTIYSKYEKDLNIVFSDLNKNSDIINGNGYRELFPNYRNELLYEIKSIDIKYKFQDSEEQYVHIVDSEIITRLENFAYGIESLGLR